MRLLPFKALWGNVVAVAGVVGTVVAVISLAQTFGWFVPSEPKPTKGLKQIEPEELTWLKGRWCGSTQVTQGNVIVFAPQTNQVFGRRFGSIDLGNGETIPPTDEFYTSARLYNSGSQSVVIDFGDGRYESWYVTAGPTLNVLDLVEELLFPRQYLPC